jgi:hypothetical protein
MSTINSGISDLIFSLANSKPTILPSAAKDWLDMNQKMICETVRGSDRFANLADKSECIHLVQQISGQQVSSTSYVLRRDVVFITVPQRFIVFTFVHLVDSDSEQKCVIISSFLTSVDMFFTCSILNKFRGTVTEWIGWDCLTTLERFRSTNETIWTFIKSIRKVGIPYCFKLSALDVYMQWPLQNDVAKSLQSILILDMFGICAQMAAVLSSPDTYRKFLACVGEKAQCLLDLLQLVRVFYIFMPATQM